MSRPAREPLQLPDLSPAGDQLIERADAARREFDIQTVAAGRLVQYRGAIAGAERIRTADFFRTVADTVMAQTFCEMRRSRGYLGLPYTDATGQLRAVEDLEEYCLEFLGKSYRRCVDLADNLHLLGPDLYEQAQSIGFKTKDYRALKALPADDQQAVKEALEEGDKDLALTVLSQLVGRHQEARAIAERQREVAIADRKEIEADYAAATAIIGERETQIRQLKGGAIPPPTLDERMAGWAPRAQRLTAELEEGLLQLTQLVQGAAAIEYPAEPAAQAAWRAALGPVEEAVSLGLARHVEVAQSLLLALERGVTDRLYATAPDPASGQE